MLALQKSLKFSIFLIFIPLVDIFFYVLFSLSLTSGFVYQSGFKVNLPSSSFRMDKKDNPLLLTVISGDKNRFYFKGKILSKNELLKNLKELSYSVTSESKIPIFLRLDKNLTIEKQIEIFNFFKEEKFELFFISSES